MLAVVMIVVAGVITWDLTHQSIPAGGVDAPVGVEAADGWLITLDDRERIVVINSSRLVRFRFRNSRNSTNFRSNSTYDVQRRYLAMANSTDFDDCRFGKSKRSKNNNRSQ